jgi:hypothetical protein
VSRPPTAFISWAREDSRWEHTIVSLAFRLRAFGVDVDVDLLHLHDSMIDWATYGVDAITRSNFVLVAVSRSYREQWEGCNDPTVGAGAAGEPNTLRGLFARNQDDLHARLKLLILPGANEEDIPLELYATAQTLPITDIDDDGLEDLVRMIHNNPAFPTPPV